MIIDQHRADLRIRYEQYLEQFGRKQSSTQRLLFPEVVQFSPSDTVVLTRIMPDLITVGFDLSDLGGGSYAVSGVPAGLEGVNPVMLLQNVVSDASTEGGNTTEQLYSTLALSLARQAAIPQGQVLSNEEMEHIVNQLFACSNVNYTPEGKSVLAILPQHDIEKLLS
jgi:DNA mismatch repair protein MutL